MRPYQIAAIDSVMREWKEHGSTLVVLPTGCGKTVVFAKIIGQRKTGRTLVIAHREELIFQAQRKIIEVTGADVHVEMGEYKSAESGFFGKPPVIVSTIQTQTAGGDGGGRMGKFDPMEFDTLIIDEAHHATATSYRRMIDYYRQNPALKVLGVTATPDRADEEALGKVFTSCAFDYEVLDAINDGWLVPVRQQMVEVSSLDFSTCRTVAGDLNGADLAEVMEYENNLHGIAAPTIEIAGDRKALVFASSVIHAERLCEIFNRSQPGTAAWVCGKTDKDERRRILADFATGKIRKICNVGVLTEGFDDSGVEIVVMARPTKSRALYAQMCGRGTRPHESIAHALNDIEDGDGRRRLIAGSVKPSCLIVDFCGNSGKHKLCTTADILGVNYDDEIVEAVENRVRKTGNPVDMIEELAAEKKRVEAQKVADAAKRASLVAKAKFVSQQVDPFDILGIEKHAPRGWDNGKQLSQKQKDMLVKQKIDPDTLSYSQSKQLIGEIFRRWDRKLPTYGQERVLRSRNIRAPLRMSEAKKYLDRIFSA